MLAMKNVNHQLHNADWQDSIEIIARATPNADVFE